MCRFRNGLGGAFNVFNNTIRHIYQYRVELKVEKETTESEASAWLEAVHQTAMLCSSLINDLLMECKVVIIIYVVTKKRACEAEGTAG